MKALRWHGREDVRLEEVPDAEVGGFADCLIEVSICGICGSDIAEYRLGPTMIWPRSHPLSGREPPITLGHELVGVLVEGSSVDGSIQPGDRVAVDACLRCEKCAACRRGDYHLCRFGGSVGLHCDGGFAPLLAVPAYTLVAVPDEVSDMQAALTEPFAVALHALERGGLGGGDDVLVLGFGPIGAATALVARSRGRWARRRTWSSPTSAVGSGRSSSALRRWTGARTCRSGRAAHSGTAALPSSLSPPASLRWRRSRSSAPLAAVASSWSGCRPLQARWKCAA